MTINWTDVTTLAPELCDLNPIVTVDILTHVNETLDPDVFSGGEEGVTYRLARIYLAAHMGTLSITGGSAGVGSVVGPVTAEQVGGISRQYGDPISSDTGESDLTATIYGRMLRDLINRSLARCPVLL